MSARKLERLLNLLMLLLSTRRPLTVEQIHQLLPGYDQPDEDAFRRMFERDKEELRELGVPVETAYLDAWETDQGYLIRRTDYELPIVELAPDEAAAVGLAARLWQSAGLAEASASALLKLRAAGIEADAVATAGVEPRVAAPEASFSPLLAAARAAQVVSFDYRTGGTGQLSRREVEPWGLVHRRGRWYLVGHDRSRGGQRVFLLSRVVGKVVAQGAPGEVMRPSGVDLRAMVASLDTDQPDRVASVRVAPDVGWEVRRAATTSEELPDGWTRCAVPFGDLDRFADWMVGFGAEVVVESPEDAVTAVVARLREVAGAVG